MKNKKKVILLTLLAGTAVGGVTIVSTASKNSKSFYDTRADLTYSVVLDGTNGNATVSSLKRNFVSAKTGLNNFVSFVYKNMETVSGKVGKIKASGFYGNTDAISGFNTITVTSDAKEGDAKIVWGYTSACVDGEADLSAGTFAISGNYFKVIAKNEITVDSIQVGFSCDNSVNGYSTKDENGAEVSNAFKFEVSSGAAKMLFDTGKAKARRVVIPDYVINGGVKYPVTTLAATGNTGLFESNSYLEEVSIPDSVTTLDKYLFYTANKIKKYTLPYGITTGSSYSIPKGDLEVLNIDAKSMTTASTIINDSEFKKLHTINISYDVEFLPNIISTWPSQKPTIFYEGTTAEWLALTNVSGTSSSWKTYTGDVICSDTTISNVNLHFENATLDDSVSSSIRKVITGKTIDDPGKPVYDGNAKKFDGWYTEATGGSKVTFPVTVSSDTDLYAHFVDWPAGSSIENAKAITSGVATDWETDADTPWFYASYTASKNEVVMFNNTGVTKTGGTGYNTPALKIFDSTKTEITGYGSKDASTDASKVARYDSGAEAWKIRFTAGETYYFALAVNKDGATFGNGTLTATAASTSDYRDYTAAGDVTLDTEIVCAPGEDFFKWYKFTPSVTRSYWFENGLNKSTVWGTVAIGTITDGSWTSVSSMNATSGSSSAGSVDLTAGTTYYFAVSSNGNGNCVFKLSDAVPQGASKSTAYDLTLNGAAVSSEYKGVANAWFKVVIPEDGSYIFRFGKVVGTSDISGQKLYDSTDKTVTMSDGADANDKIAALTAGTYYLSVPVTSTKVYSVQMVSIPDGYNAEKAIAVSIPDGGATLNLTYSLAGGTWFKFVAAKDGFVVFNDTSSFAGTFKIMTSQTSSIATMASGEAHTKVTAGTTYYICLTGGTVGTTYNFTASYVDSIQDGKTSDTAFVVSLNETKSVTYVSGSSSVYFHFNAEEDASYVVSRVSNTYTMYVYDITVPSEKPSVTVTSGQVSNDKIVSLKAGHTYEFYYTMYSNHTFKISKVGPGYSYDSAKDLNLSSSMSISNDYAGGSTYYKFTADETTFYSFSTVDSVTFKIYNSSKTSVGSSVNGTLTKKLTNGEVYYFIISSAEVTTATVSFEKVASVQDGQSLETALVATMGSSYSFSNTKSEREYIYIAVDVAPNTEYVMYTATEVDIDGEYGAGVYTAEGGKITPSKQVQDIGTNKDNYNDVSYTIKDYATGAGSNDMFVRWNSGTNTKVVLKLRQYAGGTVTIVCNFMTADNFYAK